MILQRGLCCGWRELSGVATYRGDLNNVLRSLIRNGAVRGGYVYAGAITFTEAGYRSKYGKKLAADIATHELGEVTKLPRFRNPNTGRLIQSFMWVLNEKAIITYCKKNKITIHDGF